MKKGVKERPKSTVIISIIIIIVALFFIYSSTSGILSSIESYNQQDFQEQLKEIDLYFELDYPLIFVSSIYVILHFLMVVGSFSMIFGKEWGRKLVVYTSPVFVIILFGGIVVSIFGFYLPFISLTSASRSLFTLVYTIPLVLIYYGFIFFYFNRKNLRESFSKK